MTVSYVLTVYNKAAYLPAVLAAVAAERQSTGGEIVIVDDGSTDGSSEILDGFARGGVDITVLHQGNKGVVSATNAGLRSARLPYIRLVDGDDIIVQGSTRLLSTVLEAAGSGYAFGRFADYELGASQSDFPPAREGATVDILRDPLADMIRMQLFIVSATLGRKAVYDQVTPLPEDYYIQDTSLGLRLATTTRIVRVDEVCCYKATTAAEQISDNKARMFRDTTRITRDFLRSWPLRYQAAAVRRHATRAYHYARRHIPRSRLRCASLVAIRLLSYLPIAPLFPHYMTWIADTYDMPVRDRRVFP
jgi:glycosyltransferase involved in cell wall biosynthesis